MSSVARPFFKCLSSNGSVISQCKLASSWLPHLQNPPRAPSRFLSGVDKRIPPPLPSSLRFKPVASKKKGSSAAPLNLRKDLWSAVGYSTAESYDLFTLNRSLRKQDLYEVFSVDEELDDSCICARAKYDPDDVDPGQALRPPREIFFFADGSVIFWSVPELERETVLSFLRKTGGVAIGNYERDTVLEESEAMRFEMAESGAAASHLDGKGLFRLTEDGDDPNGLRLDKFAFSNAMAGSVKLGVLETTLDRIIDSIEFLSEDMKKGRPIVMSRREVLMKTGELFALRHVLNLSSDLLDAPDFYWDREKLERIYLATCGHLAMRKRIRITNEKISHCGELLDLVTNHLNDVHHTRLEWFIIILIMIEVVFELMHFAERLL